MEVKFAYHERPDYRELIARPEGLQNCKHLTTSKVRSLMIMNFKRVVLRVRELFVRFRIILQYQSQLSLFIVIIYMIMHYVCSIYSQYFVIKKIILSLYKFAYISQSYSRAVAEL